MVMDMTASVDDADAWLEDFHAGRKATMSDLYHEHFRTVAAAVGHVVTGADKETVIHEVFFKLIASAEERRRFQGGSFGAWITTVARNHAIDHARRRGRELAMSADDIGAHVGDATRSGEAVEARVLIERFRAGLPAKWHAVFDLCFLGQLPQREAATKLGLARTTLAYQHHQIRARLRRFLVPRKEAP